MNAQVEQTRIKARAVERHDVIPGVSRPKALFILALTYVPGVGTELARNGRRLGVIEGADFSSALFAIWLGDRSLDDSLRRQLLASR